jgi:hypothetical protein
MTLSILVALVLFDSSKPENNDSRPPRPPPFPLTGATTASHSHHNFESVEIAFKAYAHLQIVSRHGEVLRYMSLTLPITKGNSIKWGGS